jgi:hypothetical protein
VIISGMAALALDGQPLLVGWVGDVAAGTTPAIVLALLTSAAILMSTYEVASAMVMLSAPSGWYCAVPILIGSIINLAVSIAGASTYGIWAVGGSTIIGNTITLLLIWRAARQLLGWSFGRLLKALLPTFSGGATAFLIGFVLIGFAHQGIIQSLFACIVTTASGVGVAALTMRWAQRSA